MALPLIPIFDILGKVLDRVIPDPAERAKMQIELAKLADADNERVHQEMLGQIATNTEEAKHRSLFIAGWRPFVGWGCGFALVYNVLLAPLILFLARLFGYAGEMPVTDTAFLQTILLAMLGVGAMRSYDKAKGTSDDTGYGPPTKTTTITTVTAPKKKGLDLWPF